MLVLIFLVHSSPLLCHHIRGSLFVGDVDLCAVRPQTPASLLIIPC
jgi:hypothetical protein